MAAGGRRGAPGDAVGGGGRGATPLRRRRRPPPRPRRGEQLLRARLHLLRHPRRQPRRRALPCLGGGRPRLRAQGGGVRLRHARHAGRRGLRHHRGVDGRRAAPHAAETTISAITLSLGERPDEDLIAWREAGADRYLLRFETSDEELYRRIHPDCRARSATACASSAGCRSWATRQAAGIMVGIPGQTHASIAADIELFRGMDMDMIGIGPYLPHPATPLGQESSGGSRTTTGPRTRRPTASS